MRFTLLARWTVKATLICALSALTVWAQCPVSVVAGGFEAPTRIIRVNASRLLVAEAGFGPNTGRISVLNPVTSENWTLIDGLPAGFSPPNNDPSGPSGLFLRGNTLYVSIGLGDAVLAGPLPNTQVPNPHPSSPLFSSLLALDLGTDRGRLAGGYSLTLDDQIMLKAVGHVTLHNVSGGRLGVRVVADFPNYVPEPTPEVPENVRQSNPFGVSVVANEVYVPDASSNSMRSVDLRTRTQKTLTTFAPLPNSAGFGPPVVEAVPNNVRRYGANVLVPLLSGFPFPMGGSEIDLVNAKTGAHAPFITGLTAAIDVSRLGQSNPSAFLTLEFSTNMLAQPQAAPGRLSLYASHTADPVVVADCLITPTSMASDSDTNSVYVTEIFTGRVMRVTLP